MILDDHFDRILVISLPRSGERAARAMAELLDKQLSDKAEIFAAIDGDLMGPSEWWQAGGPAWGCMLSHFIAITQALNAGVERLLLIEDDCIWQRNAAALVAEFLGQVPDDWGQIYLGGQHRLKKRPEWVEGRPAVLRGGSIHRTHAYAVHRRAMPALLRHIIYAPDYIEAAAKLGKKRHVDHQLEEAQKRGDWKVYSPTFWLAGQGENLSTISRKQLPDQWWQVAWGETHRTLPLVVVGTGEMTPGQSRWLHFGNHIDEKDETIDTGVAQQRGKDLLRTMELVAHEAYRLQRLPAIHAWPEKVKELRRDWTGPVLMLPSAEALADLCDYPSSKVVRHRWLNPDPGEGIVSESVEAEMIATPMVHQIWLGVDEMNPRLAAYCAGIERAFPGWRYRMWREADVAELLEKAVMPEVLADASLPVGLRADVMRLEILRQRGGVYLDIDFEALRDDLRPLFPVDGAFVYGDQKSGSPANGMIAAMRPGHPFVEVYLRRIAAALKPIENHWETVGISGPDKLAECLKLWVADWKSGEPFAVDGKQVGTRWSRGSILGLWQETIYPYHYTEGSWATFDPASCPAAWLAHHWEGSWVPA